MKGRGAGTAETRDPEETTTVYTPPVSSAASSSAAPKPKATSNVAIKVIAGVIAVVVIVLVVVLAGALSPKNLGQGKQSETTSVTEGVTPTISKTTVTVSFDANGAEGGETPADLTCAKGGSVTLPDAGSLARQGYTFAGWGESKSSNKPLEVGATFEADTDVRLYAIWKLV